MRPEQPPLRHTLPELPRGCDELRATEPPNSKTRLEAHLDCLPGLGIERANILSDFAVQPPSSELADDTTSEARVLGLEDLLRTPDLGNYALHPRVQQVVSLGALDSLLETVTRRMDQRLYYLAYQCPTYLLECRGSAPDQTTLHPPEYDISTIDVVRDLRANDFLTTVCRSGETRPSDDTLRAAIDSMERRDEHPHGVFTLRLVDGLPTLTFRDEITTGRCPEEAVVYDLLMDLCFEHRPDLELQKDSGLPWEEFDD